MACLAYDRFVRTRSRISVRNADTPLLDKPMSGTGRAPQEKYATNEPGSHSCTVTRTPTMFAL
jgi:hypothetical protein